MNWSCFVVRQQHHPLSDLELLEKAHCGDRSSFGELFLRYYSQSLRVASLYCTDRQSSEDAVAETFTSIWAALKHGRGPTGHFRAYLFTSIRRQAVVDVQKCRRTCPTAGNSTVCQNCPLRSQRQETGTQRLEIVSTLKRLPVRWRRILWMLEVQGYTAAEVGEMLEMTPGAVAASAHRAKVRLRSFYNTGSSGIRPRTRRGTTGPASRTR